LPSWQSPRWFWACSWHGLEFTSKPT